MRWFAVGVALSFAGVAHANMLPPQTTTPHTFFAGVWSFDRTCASGDGMVLKGDGKASYDEWGSGLWASAEDGARLVLIVEDITEEADRKTQAQLIEFRDVVRIGAELMMTRASDGAKMRAKRCLKAAR
ncbi:MAG: hypothetical protein HOP13_20275 [Alphaproteobacteria bacterium]|nr:hypothetical protein [Alphaproteobacteria bacterium]